MITAVELRNSEFSRSARGYKASEVDEVLEEAAVMVEQLQKENNELLRKMDILAQKIHEYRQDEDSIKDALVTAQRTADSIIRGAKEKAETENSELKQKTKEAYDEAIAKADKINKDTEEKANNIAYETKNKSISIIAEAKDKAGKMIFEILDLRRKEQANYQRLKKQASTFRVDLLNLYKAQVELINKLPESIHDEVIEPIPGVPHIEISEITNDVENIIPDDENVSDDNATDVQIDSVSEADVNDEPEETVEAEVTPFEQETVITEQQKFSMPHYEQQNEINEKEVAGGKISGGFIISQEEPKSTKFGNIKFGEYYDQNNDDDDDDEEKNSEKHSFFRKKR